MFTEVAAKVSPDQLVILCREADHNGHSKKGIALLSGWTVTPHTYECIAGEEVGHSISGPCSCSCVYTRETKRVDEVTRNTSCNQTETWRCQPLQNMPRYNHLTGSKYVFKEEQITLDIPEEGVVLHSGLTIIR